MSTERLNSSWDEERLTLLSSETENFNSWTMPHLETEAKAIIGSLSAETSSEQRRQKIRRLKAINDIDSFIHERPIYGDYDIQATLEILNHEVSQAESPEEELLIDQIAIEAQLDYYYQLLGEDSIKNARNQSYKARHHVLGTCPEDTMLLVAESSTYGSAERTLVDIEFVCLGLVNSSQLFDDPEAKKACIKTASKFTTAHRLISNLAQKYNNEHPDDEKYESGVSVNMTNEDIFERLNESMKNSTTSESSRSAMPLQWLGHLTAALLPQDLITLLGR